MLDRPCQVWRSGQLLSASQLTKPTDEEHTDTLRRRGGHRARGGARPRRRDRCRGGSPPRSRRSRRSTTTLFVTGFPDPRGRRRRGARAADGRRVCRRASSSSSIRRPMPAGFERLGRFNVIPSQPENFTDPTRAERPGDELRRRLRAGRRLRRRRPGRARCGGVEPFAVDPAAPKMDLGRFGAGELRLGALGVEIRALRSGGRFVRLRGTLDPRSWRRSASASPRPRAPDPSSSSRSRGPGVRRRSRSGGTTSGRRRRSTSPSPSCGSTSGEVPPHVGAS